MSVKVEDLCSLLPRSAIVRLMEAEGPALRTAANHKLGHLVLRRVTHGGFGRLGAWAARAAGLIEGRRPVELSLSVLRYFFEPLLEVAKVTEMEASFYLSRCPYGWRDAGDLPLCDAVMELERELVHGIGGRLVIEERIPAGARKCRFALFEKS